MSVEAALITPILILLVFGALEFGMVMKNWLAVTAAARAGARIASAEPKEASYADDAAARVAEEAGGLDPSTIQYLWVYEANADGSPQLSGGVCTRCARYQWNATTKRFQLVGTNSWPASEQNACLGHPGHDSVGVQLQIRHPGVTKLFFDTLQITEQAVMGLEPVSSSTSCS